ncbi:MAG: transposase [Candidatus Altiarchaeales archaeon]|nr:transposase [Candidatus Altiarchaeales archaeon]
MLGCGNKREITLDERTYHCSECGLVIDRDLNAALNIREEGLRILRESNSQVSPDQGDFNAGGGSSGPDEAVKRNGWKAPADAQTQESWQSVGR